MLHLVLTVGIAEGTDTQFQRCLKDLERFGAVTMLAGGAASTSEGHRVYIARPGDKDVTDYSQTGRTLAQLNRDWPPEWGDLDSLDGLKLLDMGAGFGALVRELVAGGIDAEGLDIHLPKTLQDNPRFRQADATSSGYPDGHFDVVVMTYSVFTFSKSETLMVDVLREMRRVTKHGGRVRIGPIRDSDMLKSALKHVRGLKVSNLREGQDYLPNWVELERS